MYLISFILVDDIISVNEDLNFIEFTKLFGCLLTLVVEFISEKITDFIFLKVIHLFN
jgi:hypothetical protein